jgi:serine/threonine protein phosphatase 1
MRTFVISDIHGNNELFRRTLKAVGLKKVDKLIVLGDLIDRGPDSKGVLDTIILLLENGFDVECLVGNHEQMFLDAYLNTNNLNKWLFNGGDKTLLSFLTNSIEKIPSKYLNLIKGFKYFIEEDSFILVHAALNMTIENPFTDKDALLWERNATKYLNEKWLGKRQLIHGHNPESSFEISDAIEKNKCVICIDNGVYINKPGFGSLCVLELKSQTVNFLK